MRYQLGNLPNLSDRHDHARIHRALQRFRSRLEHGDSDRQTAIHQWLREIARPQKHPDLLQSLPVEDADHEWVQEAAMTLDDLSRGSRGLAVQDCEWEPGPNGYLAIAVVDRWRSTEVRRGDVLVGGVALLRQKRNRVAVYPRIYRRVCTNGAIAYSHTAHALDTTHGVREPILACLAEATTQQAFARLQAAALVEIDDPLHWLAGLPLLLPPTEIVAAQEERDPTAYGLVNALTARARREPSLARRLEIEAGAETILRAVEARRRAPVKVDKRRLVCR